MNQREMKSFILQLGYCYSLNLYLKNSFNLNLFYFKNLAQIEAEKICGKFWNENFNEKNYFENEEIISNKNNLIYLSPDFLNIIEEKNQENYFIIGRFNDKQISKIKILFKSNSLWIKSAG